MKRAALRIAVAGLLVLALIGAASGLEPDVCSKRALAGAAMIYVLVRVGGRVVIALIAAAVAEDIARPSGPKDIAP